jgi:hypothetical protein
MTKPKKPGARNSAETPLRDIFAPQEAIQEDRPSDSIPQSRMNPQQAPNWPLTTPVKPPQRAANAFTGFYRRQDGQRPADPNGRRLASVMKMFGLAPSAVARAARVSPAYLSRVLSDSDPFVGSAGFYRRLEACLGALVEHRQTQFFRVTPMNVRAVEKAARGVLDSADAGRCLHHGGRPAVRQPGEADIIASGNRIRPHIKKSTARSRLVSSLQPSAAFCNLVQPTTERKKDPSTLCPRRGAALRVVGRDEPPARPLLVVGSATVPVAVVGCAPAPTCSRFLIGVSRSGPCPRTDATAPVWEPQCGRRKGFGVKARSGTQLGTPYTTREQAADVTAGREGVVKSQG